MTYHFTIMLMYRGCLLNEFLRTAASTPCESAPTLPVQKCVQAAIHVASFAAKIADDPTYNAVFWTTSYFTFCAISILVVYLTLYRNVENRQQLEALLERAMRGHKRLDQSTELEAQRLLEESQKLARNARSSLAHTSAPPPSETRSNAVFLPTTHAAEGSKPGGESIQYHQSLPNHGLGSLCTGSEVFHDLVSAASNGCAPSGR
jgi:hypothetical protein